MTALKERAVFLGKDADNSLNAEQFLFVMRALGFVREGETIRELYEREDEAKRLELRTMWKPFRETGWSRRFAG